MQNKSSALILGVFLFLGLIGLGYFVANGIIKFKELDRTVVVKGLSEKEALADVAIMPVKINQTGNDMETLIQKIDNDTKETIKFLKEKGLKDDDINLGSVSIVDKMANEYSNQTFSIRYVASRIINIYSHDVEKIRALSGELSDLSSKGILFKTDDYDTKIEYIYTKLNEIKPAMIEEATANARAVAQKFAQDSNSKLGKIKRATQGQFEVFSRDKNSAHIKKIRVVSTIEYYLAD